MSEYPILVARLSGDKALVIVCERCHAEAVITPDELLNEGLYECPADTERDRKASTETRCRGSAIMKYEEADQCKGCGKLGFWSGGPNGSPIDGCCSRVCRLQWEYAEQLRASAA